jgi:DNA polymerase-3 subunit delta
MYRGGKGTGLVNDLVWPMLCLEVAFEKGKPKVPAHVARLGAYVMAEKAGWLKLSPGLGPQTMAAFIRKEAPKQGLALTPAQIQLLASALPPDAALVDSELGKLALLADEHGKLPPEAAGIVEHNQDLNIFELLRIVQQQGDAPAAWRRILEDRLSGENMVFAFNAILLREARTLWQILSGQEPFLPPAVAGQKRSAARALGFAGVARIWELALVADKGIKSGERSPDQAFEMLAAELFALFGNMQLSR